MSRIVGFRTILCFICSLSSSFLVAQDDVSLVAPTSEDQIICGAGYITFTATSSIDNDALQFEWYESFGDNQLQFLGTLDGSTGRSQFITSFLITDKEFAVRVKLGTLFSPFVFVNAEVLNEATIIQQPEIQLCGEVYLQVDTNMDSIEHHQWQILVPDEFGQSFFQDLTTESSDSIVLVALETGFYRAVVTDSTGCRAISSEVEVTSDPVVEFINSAIQCYDPAIAGSDLITLTSDYGRSFTEYVWEESLDSVNFTFVSNTQSIDVSKPTAQAFDTAYYRLTITEQNCSNDTTIAVYWRPPPVGSISHMDMAIAKNDFFFCDTDAAAMKTLTFESTSPNIVVQWFSINYSEHLSLASLKSYSGENGPEAYLNFKDMSGLQFTENLLGAADEVILEQKDGNPFQVDGGLIYAIITDTISNCTSVTNGIFADSAFPFPIYGGKLAYDYEPGVDFVPACLGDELEFTSYDETADAYVWLELDEAAGVFTEIDNDATLNIIVDESYEGGTYFLEVTKNGCTGLSEGFNVLAVNPPTVEITNVEEQAISCSEIPSILLFGKGGEDVVAYQWYYSIDDVNFVLAPGDSSNHFYTATLNGYYKLEASNGFCLAETSSVYVEIPDGVDPNFIEVTLEGQSTYCEGDEVTIKCNYSGNNVGYFWYYSFLQLDGGDPSIELVELGGTSQPELTLDSKIFGSDLSEPLNLYFYILVIDGDCIYGSADIPFVMSINPSPNIGVVFPDTPLINEVLFCGNDVVNQEVEINNLSNVNISDLSYLWTRYNPEIDDYDTLPNASGTQYTITEPGRYRSVAITSDNSCSSISNSLDVLQLPAEIIGDTLYCQGNDITIQADQAFAPDLSIYTYQWFYSSTGVDFVSIANENSFELTIGEEDALYGPGFFYYEANYELCVATSDTLEISENENSFGTVFSVGTTHVKGIPFQASVSIEDGIGNVSFAWEPSEYMSFTDGPNAVFNFPETYPSQNATIQVLLSVENGCEVLHDQLITFEEGRNLTFSKFISPNGDGLNDVFRINGLDDQVPNQLKVIDSWGNELFSYSNYYNQTQESAMLVNSLKGEGVYYYIFSEDGNAVKGSFYLKN